MLFQVKNKVTWKWKWKWKWKVTSTIQNSILTKDKLLKK